MKHPDATDQLILGNALDAQTRPITISLIVPAYNEAARLGLSLQAIGTYLNQSGLPYEIIVVDDGSTDETPAVIAHAAAENPYLRSIAYSPNRGKGYAVRAGMLAAVGDYRIYTDADLSIPITLVADFYEALRGEYDIAIASRWHPSSTNMVAPPLLRRVMGAAFRRCVRLLVISDVRDTQCGCKGYRADVAQELFALSQIERFSFDAELIFLAARAGYRIKEVPFTLHYIAGSSVRPVRDSLIMLRDLLRIRLNAARGRYRARPTKQLVRRAG